MNHIDNNSHLRYGILLLQSFPLIYSEPASQTPHEHCFSAQPALSFLTKEAHGNDQESQTCADAL
jgi:hypothetical protein